MTAQTLETLAKLLTEKFDVEDQVTAESTLEGLGLDSLDVINFLYSVEEALGVKVPDEDLVTENLDTVGALAGYIEAQRQA